MRAATTGRATVVQFSARPKEAAPGETPQMVALPARSRTPIRVQVRMALGNLDQVNADLELLLGTISRAKRLVSSRCQDEAILAGVRELFNTANHALNRRPRRS